MLTLGERIRYLRENILRLNQSEFAKELGFSRGATISDYEKDKRSPDITTLRSMADIGNVTLEWLLTGNGPISADNAEQGAEAKDSTAAVYTGGFVQVKVYDMNSAKGPGGFPGAEPAGTLIIPEGDFRKGPVAIQVRGDGMSPNVLDGAIVGIDTTDVNLISGKLYAVWLSYEGATIKRVFVYPEKVVLRHDNPSFPETAIPASAKGEDIIIGRVVWLYQRY
jgi:phage repressor protein C with HTH and peptisase S24 domain